MKLATLVVGIMMVASSLAAAAGIDSHGLTCAALQSLIAARGAVFISQPFGDFVVANGSFCSSGGSVLQQRSVATADLPECVVNYCVDRGDVGRRN